MQARTMGVRVNEMIMCVRAGWLPAICSCVCISIPLTFKSRQHDATIGSSRTYFLYFAEVINLEKQTPMKMRVRELIFYTFTRPLAKKNNISHPN